MREILDASSQRIIKILEALAAGENWTTLAGLASRIGASERTVAEDLTKLRKRWGQHLGIEVSKKSGVKLKNRSVAGIGLVFAELFNDSVALRWIKELLFHPKNTGAFYENRLFVSRSTLVRLLPRINRILSKRGMAILYRNNCYQLLGNAEQSLRDFYTGFLLDLYGLDAQKFDLAVDLAVIRDLISSVYETILTPRELAWVLGDETLVAYHTLFCLVSLLREEQGYAVISTFPLDDELSAPILTRLKASFSHLKKDNLRPVCEFLFRQYRGWTSESEQAQVAHETQAFFERVFQAVSLSPEKTSLDRMHFLLRSLYLMAGLQPHGALTLFGRVRYFSLSLRRANPFLYRVVTKNLTLFCQNVQRDLSSRTAELLFWLCLACPEIYQSSQPRTALLIDDFSRPHAEFLARVLTDFFKRKHADFLRIDIAPYPEVLTSTQPGLYDLVITTIPTLSLAHELVFRIGDYPSHEDLCALYQALLASVQKALPAV